MIGWLLGCFSVACFFSPRRKLNRAQLRRGSYKERPTSLGQTIQPQSTAKSSPQFPVRCLLACITLKHDFAFCRPVNCCHSNLFVCLFCGKEAVALGKLLTVI